MHINEHLRTIRLYLGQEWRNEFSSCVDFNKNVTMWKGGNWWVKKCGKKNKKQADLVSFVSSWAAESHRPCFRLLPRKLDGSRQDNKRSFVIKLHETRNIICFLMCCTRCLCFPRVLSNSLKSCYTVLILPYLMKTYAAKLTDTSTRYCSEMLGMGKVKHNAGLTAVL